ncbi:MAG: hypothetical protein JWL70_2085 [Acidimicrobiia bacterium]|nr:hypothetical protein [Acidimicrobiia bacterium]
MIVTFYGVRGSTPCPGPDTRHYGGNTSCVAIERPGGNPLLLDLGTGLRYFGNTLALDGTFRGAALVTHLHWDHVQGLPFFAPVLREGSQLDVYGPSNETGSLAESFRRFVSPPLFPIELDTLPGSIRLHECADEELEIDGLEVTVRPVPHLGPTNGYRISDGTTSIAYVSDHQQPLDGGSVVADSVLELVDGVDLLIHDAQYTVAEFEGRSNWGHCTVDYACQVAVQAGAKKLALFHHDPGHSDLVLDELLECARRWGDSVGIEVVCASEGLALSFEDR